ncbi:hypothetical protein FIBSPDRAFT_663241, partial [Athelia psychrophila]
QEAQDPRGALPKSPLSSRRTFLASLILGSKFTQDRCYSNKDSVSQPIWPPAWQYQPLRARVLDWCLWAGQAPSS